MNFSASWEARFRAFVVNDFSLAVDAPDRGVVAAGGIEPHQLHAWDRRTGTLRPLTNGPNGILAGVISTDGRWVSYVDDAASETGVLVRVPFEGGEPVAIDPDLPAGSILGWGVAPGRLAFTLVVEDRFEHRIAEDGRPGSRLVASTGTTSWINGFADGGDTLIVIEERPSGEKDTLLLDVATGTERARAATPGASTKAYTPSPIPGDRRFLAESDESGVPRPFLWDRDTDRRVAIPVDGLEGDVRPLGWSPDGRSVLLLQVAQARMTFLLHDLESGARRTLATPPGAITGLPVTFATEFASASEILTVWQNGAHPAAILSIPLDGGAPSIALGDPAPPPGRPWRSVHFTSRDGTAVQAWLALPAGQRRGGGAVVDIHGGPGVAQFDEYLPHLAAFVDRGFAVLSLNYRSSNTFGRTFEEATLGRVGELELEDIAAAREFLVHQGIADPARILVEGWSWGGYLTLMALGRQPDLWAGGICGVGIGDMAAQHDEAVEYIAQMIARQHGGTPAEVPDRYRAASPITYAESVTAPLLVIHGRDDIRCPAGQMERYLARMAELGKDVTAEWFSAGHLGGVADPALLMGQTDRMLAFADRIVGG